jgi:hypothetical protein
VLLNHTAAAYGMFQVVFGDLSDHLAFYTFHLRKRHESELRFEAVFGQPFGQTFCQFKRELERFDKEAEADSLCAIRGACDKIAALQDWRNKRVHARYRQTPDGYALFHWRSGNRLEMFSEDIEKQIQLACKVIVELEADVLNLTHEAKWTEEFEGLFEALPEVRD